MKSNLEFTIRVRVNAVDQTPEIISVLPEPQSNTKRANRAYQQTISAQRSGKPRRHTCRSAPEMQATGHDKNRNGSGSNGSEDSDAGFVDALLALTKEKGRDPTKFAESEDSPPTLNRSLDYDTLPFKFTAARAIVNFQFDVKSLMRVLGGQRSPVVWRPAKPSRGDRRAYLRPCPSLNPFRPRSPGAHGFVVGSLQQELAEAGIKARKLPLFLTGTCTSYAGTYMWQDVEPLSYMEWKRLGETFKDRSIKYLLTKKQHLTQLKVAQWKVSGHWPSDSDVDREQDYTTVTNEDVVLAIQAGVLRIPISAVRCIGYDCQYVRDLIRKTGNPLPEDGPKEAAPTCSNPPNMQAELTRVGPSMDLNAAGINNSEAKPAGSGYKRQAGSDSDSDIQEIPVKKATMKVGPPKKKLRQTVEVVIPAWPKRDAKAVSAVDSGSSKGSSQGTSLPIRRKDENRDTSEADLRIPGGLRWEDREESPEV